MNKCMWKFTKFIKYISAKIPMNYENSPRLFTHMKFQRTSSMWIWEFKAAEKKSMINLIETKHSLNEKKCWMVWTFPLWIHYYHSIIYSPHMLLRRRRTFFTFCFRPRTLIEGRMNEEVNRIYSIRLFQEKREKNVIDNLCFILSAGDLFLFLFLVKEDTLHELFALNNVKRLTRGFYS